MLERSHNVDFFLFGIQFDFVYITGDIPAHDVWEITREEAVREKEIIHTFLAVARQSGMLPLME